MIDHISLNVKDINISSNFYEHALNPIGYERLFTSNTAVGFGEKDSADLWIVKRNPVHTSFHIAFQTTSRKDVDRFYSAAIKAGGVDNGSPGLRSHYHINYYAAFVLDPLGNNIEVVCHKSL